MAIPRHALVIAIGNYEHFADLPGAAVDRSRAVGALQDEGFGVDELSGSVPMAALASGTNKFVEKISGGARLHADVLVAVVVACHGVQTKASDQTFPELLATDSPRPAHGQPPVGFDVCDNLISKLNDIAPCRDGSLQIVMVFDCCRQNAANHCWRSASFFPSLRNDFYMIFACDPGRRAAESMSDGGAVIREFVALLPYAQSITHVLEAVAQRVVAGGLCLQRPWVYHRVGASIPVLGRAEGQLPDAGGAPSAPSDGARDPSPQGQKSLVLVGRTGSGKSTLGNALLRRPAFAVSDEENSETKHAQHGDGLIGDCPCRVVDTVGFLDTALTAGGHLDKFAEFADLAPGGVDVFVLVMCLAGGRFTAEHTDALGAFREAAGSDVLAHTVVAFTFVAGSAPVRRAEDALTYCSQSPNARLRELVTEVQGVVALDLDGSDAACEEARGKILAVSESPMKSNGGRTYSNAELDAAWRRRQALRAVVEQLAGDRRRSFEARCSDVERGASSCQDVLDDAWDAADAQGVEEARRAELDRLRRVEGDRAAAEAAEAAAAAAAAEQEPPEERKRKAREAFGARNIDTDADPTVRGLKFVWNGTARDVATGVQATSTGRASRNGAKNHARDALFDVMYANGMLG